MSSTKSLIFSQSWVLPMNKWISKLSMPQVQENQCIKISNHLFFLNNFYLSYGIQLPLSDILLTFDIDLLDNGIE
jgi:hypothetical protein